MLPGSLEIITDFKGGRGEGEFIVLTNNHLVTSYEFYDNIGLIISVLLIDNDCIELRI